MDNSFNLKKHSAHLTRNHHNYYDSSTLNSSFFNHKKQSFEASRLSHSNQPYITFGKAHRDFNNLTRFV